MPEPSEPGADLTNWRKPPHSRWAFRNVQRIMPTAAVRAGAMPRPLAEAPRSLDGFQLTAGGGEVLSLEGFLRATATDAFIILKDGAVVFESYDHGNDPHVPHIAMSATKSVTGLVAGILAGQGVLDVEAPVSAYVPEIEATAWRGATIRHLLDMRAGVVFDEAAQRAYNTAGGWEPGAGDLQGFFAALKVPPRSHGGPFRYVSANTDLLGWAMERASGKPFAELVSTLLWQPMGAEDDGFITTDARGAARATGGLCTTLRDFARLGQLLVEGGMRDGREVVPAAWLDDIENGGDAEAWNKGEFAPGFAGMHMRYRSGWYVVDDAPKMIFAMGIFGQNLFVDRANRIVIAKLSSQAEPIDYTALPLTQRAVAQLRRLLAK